LAILVRKLIRRRRKLDHFYDVFTTGKADAALAASIFHFREYEVSEVKDYLADKGIIVRKG
jgi:cyclase